MEQDILFQEKSRHPLRTAFLLGLGILALAVLSFYVFFSTPSPSPLPLHVKITHIPMVQTSTTEGHGAISGEIATLETPKP